MLHAYLDDSVSHHANPRVFMLGGYIATTDVWAKFSADWQQVLDSPPHIEYFKAIEALNQKGQFIHWSEERSKERMAACRSVIEKYEPVEYAFGFNLDEFQKHFGTIGRVAADPYYFGIVLVTIEIARALEENDLARQPIDIYFDSQVKHKDKLMAGWEQAKSIARKIDPPDLFENILRNPPMFQDDKDVLPLQAADLHTTWTRICLDDKAAGRTPKPPPGFTKMLKGSLNLMRESHMEAFVQKYKDRFLEP